MSHTPDGPHCPFLNRDDPRCAGRLRVGQLDFAFAHCAGDYGACPTYRALLADRRAQQRDAAEARAFLHAVELTVAGHLLGA